VVPDEHAIVYSYGQQPSLLPGEQELSKHPICIQTAPGERPMSMAARIYFGIHHPIQYNVKVKDVGQVLGDYLPTFLGYWAQENGIETQQTAEITAEATIEMEDIQRSGDSVDHDDTGTLTHSPSHSMPHLLDLDNEEYADFFQTMSPFPTHVRSSRRVGSSKPLQLVSKALQNPHCLQWLSLKPLTLYVSLLAET
jgi:hypothetical protein